jgi:predicted TIM-barrel fold metal-dependent hydrolase
MTTPTRIDTHAHFLPNFYRDALVEGGITKPDGMPAIPPWDESEHLKFMKNAGISKSYLSISTPGVHFGDLPKAKSLARRVNEHAADLSRRHPGRFGSFASLPLPDIEASLDEIAFALDELKADGFTLLTNYHGIYLGDKAFDPVFQELSRRKAKVFLHPTTGCQCLDSTPQPFRPLDYPSPIMEFFFDAARAVVHLIMSGTVTANPNITFLIPHCGGVLPPLIDRFISFGTKILQSDSRATVTEEEIKDILRNRFYYDLAGFSMGNQVHGLLRWTGSSQLLYGSDYPYTPAEGIEYQAGIMDKEAKLLWNSEEIERVYTGNAERLFKK